MILGHPGFDNNFPNTLFEGLRKLEVDMWFLCVRLVVCVYRVGM